MDNRDPPIERRNLLKSGLLMSATTILAGCGSSRSRTTQIENRDDILESLDYSRNELNKVAESYLLNVPSRRDDLQLIGDWYLAKFDSESNEQSTAGRINETMRKLALDESKRNVQRQLFNEIQRDFEMDGLTVVRGWWFSTTEARICSVLFLLQ